MFRSRQHWSQFSDFNNVTKQIGLADVSKRINWKSSCISLHAATQQKVKLSFSSPVHTKIQFPSKQAKHRFGVSVCLRHYGWSANLVHQSLYERPRCQYWIHNLIFRTSRWTQWTDLTKDCGCPELQAVGMLPMTYWTGEFQEETEVVFFLHTFRRSWQCWCCNLNIIPSRLCCPYGTTTGSISDLHRTRRKSESWASVSWVKKYRI